MSPPAPEPSPSLPLRVDDLVTSPDGHKLAFLSNAINQRQEKYEDVEIYVVDLQAPTIQPRRITHNQAEEVRLRWANDSRHLLFSVEVGDVSGPYRDLQPHLYWVDTISENVEQWAKEFIGPIVSYEPSADGVVLTARLGTEVHVYSAANPADSLHSHHCGRTGTYEGLSTAIAHAAGRIQLLVVDASPPKYISQTSAGALRSGPRHYFFQQALHRARASAGQALPVEGRRRDHCRRHADLSSGQI